MQNEFLFVLAAGVGIKFLRIVAGAERGERNGLGFAAREKRRTVSARQDAHLAGNRTHHVKGAAVKAFAVV